MLVASPQTSHGEAVSSSRMSPSQLKACWFGNDQIADGLDFGLATDRNALEQALRLQHDQYVAQGYMDSHPSGWRLSLHNGLPSTQVFVARAGDRVVATMTLIVDSPLGLPMDEIYADELRGLRGEHRNMAEVSGLAVDPDYQRSGVAILLRLIRMLVLYSIEKAHVSDLCIAINPHHAIFYRKAFHFQVIGGLKQYRKVNGAPAVALRLDLSLGRTLMREVREGHPMLKEVYSFLFSPQNLEPVMARLLQDLQEGCSRIDQVAYFFCRHEAWSKASEEDRAYILRCCGSETASMPRGASRSTRDGGIVRDAESLRLALA
jgi:GNAT superfamily N-acetyltransferase